MRRYVRSEERNTCRRVVGRLLTCRKCDENHARLEEYQNSKEIEEWSYS
jgi:hypothetical protein